jgi:hypothetical protein
MANFCPSCGGKLDTASKFCPACGQAVAAAATPAAAPPSFSGTPATSAPSSAPVGASGGGSNAAAKILFAILGVICLFALLAAGSCFYIGYRVKQRASALSKTYGLNSTPYHGRKDACGFVSKSDVSAAFGEPVRSVNDNGSSCEYVFPGDGSRRMAIQFTWEGGTMVMKLSHGAMKGVAGMDTFTSVPGLGDEAYVEPMGSGLMMRKGDVMVNIDLRTAGLNAEGAKKIAAKIADRL